MQLQALSTFSLIYVCVDVLIVTGVTVTLSGSGSYAELGQTNYRFNCTVTNDDDPSNGTVTFSRGTTQISSFNATSPCTTGPAEPGYTQICGQNGQFYLNINTVDLRDDAPWKCTRGSQDSNIITLSVYYAPTISVIPSPYRVVEFTILRIDCSSYTTIGNPSSTSYTWTYGGSTVSTGAILSISSINRTQAGQYTCNVTNTAGSAHSTTTVHVQYAPSIHDFPSIYRVIESSHLRINCSSYTTVGDPPTTSYTWSYGGSAVGTVPVLDINNITRSQEGQYICTATNTLTPTGESQQQGKATEQVSVDVQYAPSMPNFPSTYRVTESSRLRVDCSSYTAEGNPQATNYIWSYGGSIISTVSVLDINNIKRNLTGHYICTATNTLTQTGGSQTQGKATGQVGVDVQYKPTISDVASSYDVTEGLHLLINCTEYTIPGNPPLTNYVWTGPGSYTSSGPVLSINNISRSQTGRYTCNATNSLTPTGGSQQTGIASGAFNVNVQYAPDIAMRDTTIKEGETLKLPCKAAGRPEIYDFTVFTQYWGSTKIKTRGGHQTTNDTYTLTIDKASYLDSGEYECGVNNNIIGNGSLIQMKKVHVHVQGRPVFTKDSMVDHAGEIGDSVTIYKTFYSTENYSYIWTFKNDDFNVSYTETLSPTKVTLDIYGHIVEDKGWNVTLTVADFQQKDVGPYTVVVCNLLGCGYSSVELTAAGITSEQSSLQTGAIVGLSVGLLAIISIILGIIFLYRRGYRVFKQQQNISNNRVPTGENDTDDTQANDGTSAYDNLERSTTQQYAELRVYQNMKQNAKNDQGTYENLHRDESGQIQYENVQQHTYQNSGAGIERPGTDHIYVNSSQEQESVQ